MISPFANSNSFIFVQNEKFHKSYAIESSMKTSYEFSFQDKTIIGGKIWQRKNVSTTVTLTCCIIKNVFHDWSQLYQTFVLLLFAFSNFNW